MWGLFPLYDLRKGSLSPFVSIVYLLDLPLKLFLPVFLRKHSSPHVRNFFLRLFTLKQNKTISRFCHDVRNFSTYFLAQSDRKSCGVLFAGTQSKTTLLINILSIPLLKRPKTM